MATKRAALYDVECSNGEAFVLSAASKPAAEQAASTKLADAGQPEVTFTVTLAQPAAKVSKPGEASLLDGLTGPTREAKPDPKPAGKKQARKPAAAKRSTGPTAASTKRQIAAAAKADNKPERKPSTPKAKQPTKSDVLLGFSAEAATIWNGLTEALTSRDARTQVLHALEKAHPSKAGGFFYGSIPMILRAEGIDAKRLPEHLVKVAVAS